MAFCKYILDREIVLRRTWKIEELQRGEQAEPDDGAAPAGAAAAAADRAPSGAEAARVRGNTDAALKNPYWWSYIHMLFVLNEFLERLSSWAASCSCCPSALKEYLKENGHRDLLNKVEKCPRRGQNASRCACGEFLQVAHEFMRFAAAELAVKFTADVQPSDRVKIMAAFEQGRAHIMLILYVRNSSFVRLPLKLVGLGHPDVNVARRCAVDCLAQWGGLTMEERRAAHNTSQFLLQEGSEGRASMVQFIGSGVADGTVKQSRQKFMFAMNTEISVERKHAEIHAGIRLVSNHTPALASL